MGEFNRNKYIFSSNPSIVDVSSKAIKDRANQISLMTRELFLYKIIVKDLVSHFPSYRDRNLILNISYYIVEDIELLEKDAKEERTANDFNFKKDKGIENLLEVWQDYIIAYVVILSNPNYKGIQDYIRIEYKEESKALTNFESKDTSEHRGIVLKVGKRSSIILTSSGEFVTVKDNDSQVGCEVKAKERKGLRHYKLQVAIVTLLIILTGFGVYNEYNKQVSTIVVKTTSQIKYGVNRFNKVIYTHAPSEKGKELVASVDPLDKSVDKALQGTIQYASEKGMIPQNGIVITVNGKPLKYGTLLETGNYIVEEKISILVNNVGNQHNLYESIVNQREESDEKDNKKE